MNPPPTVSQPMGNMNLPDTTAVTNTISNAAENVSNSFSSMNNSIGNTMSDFSSKISIDAGSEFLQSNSAIAKFVFLIFVLIMFMILMNLGIMLIGYFMQPSKNPYLVKGMISGNTSIRVTQDPKDTNSVPIYRSNNQKKGIEFTWSVWLYITDIGQGTAKYMHIFNKGNNNYDATSGIATVNNGPGLYLAKDTNTLHLVMDTVNPDDKNNTFDITNIPLNKWVNVAMRLQNKIMDVYVNGTIASRFNFSNVPKQNFNDVYVCNNAGFTGNLSNLRYHDYAMNVFEINNMVLMGPDTKTSDLASNAQAATGDYSYLSSSWYMSKQS